MAETRAGGPTGKSVPERVVASVTDAVRVATEASLAPAPKASARRDAAGSRAAIRVTTASGIAAPEIRAPEGVAPEAMRGMASELVDQAAPTVSLLDPAPEPELATVADRPDAHAVDADVLAAVPMAPATDLTPAAGAEPAGAAVTMSPAEPFLPVPRDPVTSDVDTAVHVPMPVPNIAKMETIMTTAEDLMSFQQGNFEALVKSGQIWAAGLQDLGRHFAASAQAQMDETMGTVKAMTSVKSLREAVELQSTLARSSMEKVVTEGGKITDATMKLAEQTMAPITARLTLAAERFGRTAA